MRGDLLRAAFLWPQHRSGGGVFRGDSESATRLHHALHVSLHICGGPLPISREHWTDCADFSRPGSIFRFGEVRPAADMLPERFDYRDTMSAHMAPKFNL